jgi:SAM-dependent methyltransferase
VTPPTAGARYDRRYFDRWYRGRGFGSPARLARKVQYAVGACEYVTERPVRRVLDVGCGEGTWQPVLARLRPSATYLGIDPSTYAVDRFGARRNLRLGTFGALDEVLAPAEAFDLIVCADVLGYVEDGEVAVGLAAIAAHLRGVALLEVFTTADRGRIEGDLDGYRLRSPQRWARWFGGAGLERFGPHLYAGSAALDRLAALERPLA